MAHRKWLHATLFQDFRASSLERDAKYKLSVTSFKFIKFKLSLLIQNRTFCVFWVRICDYFYYKVYLLNSVTHFKFQLLCKSYLHSFIHCEKRYINVMYYYYYYYYFQIPDKLSSSVGKKLEFSWHSTCAGVITDSKRLWGASDSRAHMVSAARLDPYQIEV